MQTLRPQSHRRSLMLRRLLPLASIWFCLSDPDIARAQSGVRSTIDGKVVLVNKDVDDERWAIAYDPADGTATGNVFFPAGGEPAFVWCETRPQGGTKVFDCYGTDRCVASPCLSSDWQFLRTVDDLPITFFDPPGASRRDVASIEELREAIQSEPAGAIVHLRAGMYLVTESIEVARDDLTIEGEGDLTVLILAGHVNAPMFVLGDPTEVGPVTHRGLVLARMRLSGNRTQQDFELATSPGRGHLTNSCVIVREAENVVVQDVIVEGCRSAGVLLEERCRNVQLLRIDAFDNEVDGIAWDGDVQNSRLSGSTLRDNGYGGLSFDLGPSSNLVDRCHIFGNARVGVFLSNSDDNVFRENVIERNGEDGVYIRDGNQKFQPGSISTDNLFLENQILFNLRNGVWQGGFGSTGNRVSGGIVGCNGDAPLVSADPSAAPLLVDADVAVYAPEDAPELCSTLQ